MKITRAILGLICLVLAAVPPYVLYLHSGGEYALDASLFLCMLAASVTSFGVFSITKRMPSYRAQLIAGILGSYFAILCLLLTAAALRGEFVETFMWTPIIILFGIPYLAPLIAISWLSSTLVFGFKK